MRGQENGSVYRSTDAGRGVQIESRKATARKPFLLQWFREWDLRGPATIWIWSSPGLLLRDFRPFLAMTRFLAGPLVQAVETWLNLRSARPSSKRNRDVNHADVRAQLEAAEPGRGTAHSLVSPFGLTSPWQSWQAWPRFSS